METIAPPAGGLRTVAARLPAWAAPAAVAAGVAAVGVFAAVVPPHGQHFYPRCPLYEATGVLCPGCGATRAVSALCSGHLGAALHDNLLLVLAVPVLLVVWAAWLARRLGGPDRLARLRWPPAMQVVIPTAMVVFSVARNLPFAPFHALAPLG